MSTASIWLVAAVLSAAVAIGTLSFGLLVLAGLIPILVFVVLSRNVLVGLAGMATGFGSAWTATLFAAGGACVGDGCSPASFAVVAIAVLAAGIVASAAALRQNTGMPGKEQHDNSS